MYDFGWMGEGCPDCPTVLEEYMAVYHDGGILVVPSLPSKNRKIIISE